MLLALLKQRVNVVGEHPSRSGSWQDLCILAAEIQRGTIVRQGDANYMLMNSAARTIQHFLDSSPPHRGLRANSFIPDPAAESEMADWIFGLSPEPWNMETDFWQNLGQHPW